MPRGLGLGALMRSPDLASAFGHDLRDGSSGASDFVGHATAAASSGVVGAGNDIARVAVGRSGDAVSFLSVAPDGAPAEAADLRAGVAGSRLLSAPRSVPSRSSLEATGFQSSHQILDAAQRGAIGVLQEYVMWAKAEATSASNVAAASERLASLAVCALSLQIAGELCAAWMDMKTAVRREKRAEEEVDQVAPEWLQRVDRAR